LKKTAKKARHSARFTSLATTVDKEQLLTIEEALSKVKTNATAKFVESVDLAVVLGVDPRKSDQNVRGLTSLPHGTGKVKKVAVLAKGDHAKEAEKAGADHVGDEDLITKIQNGFKDFEVVLASEEMAPQLGKVGRVLGAKTPNKRNGTVTNNIGTAVAEIKAATRIEYRLDKAGVVHLVIGKVNFSEQQLHENFMAALTALVKAKPSSAKGRYIKSITVSSTMGPGVAIDPSVAAKL
jgi:large subunit ribosomal protein L1